MEQSAVKHENEAGRMWSQKILRVHVYTQITKLGVVGHSGKQGNHKTWDSGPIPMGEATGGKKYLQCRAEHRATQVLKS